MPKLKKMEVVPPKPLFEMDEHELSEFRDEWFEQGNCVGANPNIFFPQGSAIPPEAEAYCNGGTVRVAQRSMTMLQCPVKNTCFAWARASRQSSGIWGGQLLDGMGLDVRSRKKKYKRRVSTS